MTESETDASEESLDDLRVRVEAGEAEAQFNLGCHFRFHGDATEAVRWSRLAAELGDAVALYNLGFKYAYARGVAQDLVQAHKWSHLEAASG